MALWPPPLPAAQPWAKPPSLWLFLSEDESRGSNPLCAVFLSHGPDYHRPEWQTGSNTSYKIWRILSSSSSTICVTLSKLHPLSEPLEDVGGNRGPPGSNELHNDDDSNNSNYVFLWA